MSPVSSVGKHQFLTKSENPLPASLSGNEGATLSYPILGLRCLDGVRDGFQRERKRWVPRLPTVSSSGNEDNDTLHRIPPSTRGEGERSGSPDPLPLPQPALRTTVTPLIAQAYKQVLGTPMCTYNVFGSRCLSSSTYTGKPCLLYTSPSPRDGLLSRMPSSA